MRAVIAMVLAATISSTAAADPIADARHVAMERRALVAACAASYDRLTDVVLTNRDAVFANAYDFHPDGFILHNSLQIYMRDTRVELIGAREAFHRLYHADFPSPAACDAAARGYEVVFQCYFRNAVANDPCLNRQCSDIYDRYAAPDRFYDPACR